MQRLRVPYAILLSLLLSGCAKTIQGYPGPERPENEVSIIGRGTPFSSISAFTVDGTLLRRGVIKWFDPDKEIAVLPGTHQINISYGFLIKKENCSAHNSTDDSSYQSCLNEQKKKPGKSCSTSDFQQYWIEYDGTYYEGPCAITLKTVAGEKRYLKAEVNEEELKVRLTSAALPEGDYTFLVPCPDGTISRSHYVSSKSNSSSSESCD